MIKISKVTLGVLGGFLVLVSFAGFPHAPQKDEQPTPQPSPYSEALETNGDTNINDLPLRDNDEVYKYDDPSSVVVIYITVMKGNKVENADYTWAQVNSFSKWTRGSRSANDVVGRAEAIIQFGDETGPLPGEVGYDAVVPNGTIQIRGASNSAVDLPQKSYKVELNKNAGTWRGQSTLDLNKHIFDISRIRNKLAFDLLKDIPNLTSLRTQFVHLYIKDMTANPPGTRFVDYGLYTQVEQVNKAFLESRLLDPNGQLYKATSFEFYRYEDQIMMEEDPGFDGSEFSHRLEIKGNQDHSKLINMLNDINNYEIPIQQSFERYFNQENYFTWLGFNILLGNIDTQNQNFFLYSPQNSEKWYFLPWDYDDSLFRLNRIESGEYSYLDWEMGVSNYWGVVLHNRVLRLEKYRQMLDNEINELMKVLTPDRINGLLDIYRPVTEPYVFGLPDVKYLPGPKAAYNRSYSLIPDEIQNNYKLYRESLEMPMPFYLGIPEISNDVLKFDWDESYNFKPENITYHFMVGTDVEFKNIAYDMQLVNVTEVSVPILESGKYFWKVIATNEDGKSQTAFDGYSIGPRRYSGVKSFSITADGQVLEE